MRLKAEIKELKFNNGTNCFQIKERDGKIINIYCNNIDERNEKLCKIICYNFIKIKELKIYFNGI